MQTINHLNQTLGELVNDWRPAKFPPHTELQGKYCILEPLNIALHGKKLFAALKPNTTEWTYLPYGPFNSFEEFSIFLQTLIDDNDTVAYAIIKSDHDFPVGISSYLRITPVHGAIEVGHLHYAKSLQKTPAATEAMLLLMRRAFEELGYRRYEWKCNALNQPSRLAAERLGFKFEGIFRQHLVFKQRSRDTAWFSIIDKEWLEVKSRLEQWLHPDNFDIHGKQICRLKDIKSVISS